MKFIVLTFMAFLIRSVHNIYRMQTFCINHCFYKKIVIFMHLQSLETRIDGAATVGALV